MSSEELGSPAYKKYDIEGWMAGNKFYGEVCSSCLIMRILFKNGLRIQSNI